MKATGRRKKEKKTTQRTMKERRHSGRWKRTKSRVPHPSGAKKTKPEQTNRKRQTNANPTREVVAVSEPPLEE